MRVTRGIAFALSLGLLTPALFIMSAVPTAAQVSIDLRVDVAPPPLVVYTQPPLPAPGYVWTPGFWSWDGDIADYYWVPGAWVAPPRVGLLWTPGYWAWNDGVYLFRGGYWGSTVGFYGGVNYGFGYNGGGYSGGEWRGNQFYYNRSVSNVTNVNVTNVYNKTVVVNQNAPRTSFNGGPNGVTARPTTVQVAAARAMHVPATAAQVEHVNVAKAEPQARFSANKGHPATAVVDRPVGTGPKAEPNPSPAVAALPGEKDQEREQRIQAREQREQRVQERQKREQPAQENEKREPAAQEREQRVEERQQHQQEREQRTQGREQREQVRQQRDQVREQRQARIQARDQRLQARQERIQAREQRQRQPQ